MLQLKYFIFTAIGIAMDPVNLFLAVSVCGVYTGTLRNLALGMIEKNAREFGVLGSWHIDIYSELSLSVWAITGSHSSISMSGDVELLSLTPGADEI